MFAITTIALATPTGRSIEMQARHQRFYREQRRQWIRQHSNTIEAELAVPGIVTMRPLDMQLRDPTMLVLIDEATRP